MSSDGKPNQAAAHAERSRSANRRVYVIGCLCIAITLLAPGFAIRELYRSRIAEETQSTRNLAVVLAEQTARSIQSVDLIVQDTRRMALVDGVTDPDQFRQRMATPEIHQYLVDRLRSLPQASSIAVIDNRGTIVNFSRVWPVPVIHADERDFFRHFRDQDDSGSFIGGPILDKYDGAWATVVSRRVSGSHGEFLGVVAGVIEAPYFEDFYRAVATYEGESVALLHRDGTVLARYPRLASIR